MANNTEQAENHSTEEQVAKIEKMPSKEDFSGLDTDVKRGLLEKFGASEEVEQEEQNSDTPKEESADEKDESTDETNDGDDKKKEKEKAESDKKKEDKPAENEKQNKELQAEFTRRSQRLKKVESENGDLRERLAKLEGLIEGKSQDANSVDEKDNPLTKLAEENPKLAPLLDAVKSYYDTQIDGVKKNLQADKDALTKDKLTTAEEGNLDTFRESLNTFLDGPLKDMEEALDVVIADRFTSVEEMESEAKTNPELWSSLEGKLYKEHRVKINELLEKQDEDSAEKEVKKRNKEIEETGVSGKSKTAVKTSDSSSLKSFNKLSTKDKRAWLKKNNAVSDD